MSQEKKEAAQRKAIDLGKRLTEERQRTEAQNRSLHLWFRQVAKTLNDEGISQQVFIQALIDHGLEVPWTEESFKHSIWSVIAKAMTGVESTTEAGTTDYNAEYQGLCKFAATRLHVTLPPWPDRLSQAENEAPYIPSEK